VGLSGGDSRQSKSISVLRIRHFSASKAGGLPAFASFYLH
jgi:hypothetical protein